MPSQYYTRGDTVTMSMLDTMYGTPSDEVLSLRDQYVGAADTIIPIHDTYSIDNYIETPTFIGNNEYSEDLYTQSVKSFISSQNGINPFFIYYSLQTSHGDRIHPPDIRPDGSTMDYTPCYNAYSNGSVLNCDLNNDALCVFCKQLLYAEQSIAEIIEEIKSNDKIKWNETIIIITSSNGGARKICKQGIYPIS